MIRFVSLYGGRPVHLAVMMFAFTLIGYTLSVTGPAALWNPAQWCQSIAVWFINAALVHDLVLFPIYCLADRSLLLGLRALHRTRVGSTSAVPVLNFIRVPALELDPTALPAPMASTRCPHVRCQRPHLRCGARATRRIHPPSQAIVRASRDDRVTARPPIQAAARYEYQRRIELTVSTNAEWVLPNNAVL